MRKKLGAPPPQSSRDIRQDMIGLLTQSSHMSPRRAIDFAKELGKWVFEPEPPKDRALRWWACKCTIISITTPGIQARHVVETAAMILEFLDEDPEDQAEEEAELVVMVR